MVAFDRLILFFKWVKAQARVRIDNWTQSSTKGRRHLLDVLARQFVVPFIDVQTKKANLSPHIARMSGANRRTSQSVHSTLESRHQHHSLHSSRPRLNYFVCLYSRLRFYFYLTHLHFQCQVFLSFTTTYRSVAQKWFWTVSF